MQRRWWTLGSSAAVLLFGLACSGMMPGTQLGAVATPSGTPASLSITVPSDGDVALWLRYDLDFTKPWRVDGPIKVSVGKTVVRTETVAYEKGNGPLASGGAKITFGTVDTELNGAGSTSGSVKLLNVPGVQAGDVVLVETTLTVPGHVTVNALELQLTD